MNSMNQNSEIKDLEDRLRNVILNTCNTIGCADCGLSWNDGKDCSATELQSKIMKIQFEDKNETQP